MALDEKTIAALEGVATATLTTVLLKKVAEEQRTGQRFYFKEQAADLPRK